MWKCIAKRRDEKEDGDHVEDDNWKRRRKSKRGEEKRKNRRGRMR